MKKRPLDFESYMGQEMIKAQLRISIEASKIQKRPLKHILLTGNAGLGKTTLAQVIANEMGAEFKSVIATNIRRKEDILELLARLSDPPKAPDIVFIDEIHNLPLVFEEVFYSAMEDFIVDIETPKGLQKRWIPPFTLIGATTRAGDLSRPLRDRFGMHFELQNYSNENLAQLLTNYAKRNRMKITPKASRDIASRSRGVARIAINYLEACNDYAIIFNNGEITSKMTGEQFDLMQIDKHGLNITDYKVLQFLATQTRPVGIAPISTAIDVDRTTLETITEPYLAQKQLITRTRSGREITEKGLTILGIVPEEGQTTEDDNRLRV